MPTKARLGALHRERHSNPPPVPDAALLLTANSSQFQKLDIKEKANIQNAGLTGKKFAKPGPNPQLRQTGSLRDAAAMKTGGSNAWANSSGKV